MPTHPSHKELSPTNAFIADEWKLLMYVIADVWKSTRIAYLIVFGFFFSGCI